MNSHSLAPAYTAVQTPRLTLLQPPPPPPPPPPPQEAAKASTSWPESVKNYVRRSFAPENIIPSVERSDMEAQLKKTITQAAETGTILTIDWDNHLTPQQIIQQARAFQSYSNFINPVGNKKKRSYDEGLSGVSYGKNNPQDADQMPPWRKDNKSGKADNKSQNKRADKKQKKSPFPEFTSKSKEELESRKQRFDLAKSSGPVRHHSWDDDEISRSTEPIIGTCQDIFKSYFRLTRPPRAHEVRPQSVLEQTLKLLKQQWRAKSDYGYVCDQLKALRQDLFVQHIKNAFTVEVYETHAVIALEKGDLGEFNQCQTQLRALYAQTAGGRPAEFTAYRILYLIHTGVRTDLNQALAELTPTDKEEPPIKHALQVRSAVALGNYHKLFQLYHDCPNMGPYLMDAFVNRERLHAMAKICQVYKNQDLAIRLLSEELGFESDQDAVQFLVNNGAPDSLKQTDDVIVLQSGIAAPVFKNAAEQAKRSVDIKGQI